MAEGKDNTGHEDEADFRPSWPRRPDTGQLNKARPRLDPPIAAPNKVAVPEATPQTPVPKPITPTPWTSHPTSHDLQGYSIDDPSSTRVLPIVQAPSPFDKNKLAPPLQPPAQSRSEPLEPQSAVKAPFRDRNRQHERDEAPYAYDNYDYDPTLPYTPQQRPQQRPQPQQRSYPQPPAPRIYSKGGADPSKSFLSVEIDGVKERRSVRWIAWLLLGVISIALIVGIAFALAWQGQFAGKVYAGVQIMGIDMGGKTPEEAKRLLTEEVKAFTTEPVVLSWQDKEWRPSLDDLGVKLSIDSTVAQAFAVGRGGDFFGDIEQQWGSAQSGYMVPLTVQLSEPTLKSYLEQTPGSEISQELFEGDVRLNGTEIEAMPGKEGRSLNVYGAIDSIRASVAKLESSHIDLPVNVVQPAVSAEEVASVKELLIVRLSSPITATTITKSFTLDREQIINFTTIERNPDRNAKKHIELGWKDNELKILADKWTKEANNPARDAKFAWNNGSLSVKTESIDGFETNRDDIIKAIKENADTADKRTFSLPGKVLTPTVSSKDLPSLGITELMGSGVSTFQGSSQERATNIRVAGELLNGAVIPPGGTFSFLKTMGGIDEDHGFVEGYVIAAERTQRGVGGGVCQVSTTMFRAAFWSGLKITERNQHSYRVGWYEANGEPVGFDAAVFDPGVDLQFVNTTPHYILIEAVYQPGVLTVNVYGTKLPGEVKLEGPVISNRLPPPPDVYEVDSRLPPGTKKQVETAHAGLTTVITRRMVTQGQPDQIDQFNSTYQPWPNWYIVASAAQIPGGSKVAPNPTPNP